MLTQNYTGEEKQKTFHEFDCPDEFTGEDYKYLILLVALNIFLSFTAFLGNTLILVALRKNSSLHPPSKLLYRNLAITDFCVGVIVEPVSVIYWMSLVMERWSLCRTILAKFVTTSSTLCTVSLLTVTSISVDRLLALSLGLRYKQVVTLKRTYVAVFAFWVVSIIGTAMYFFNPRIIFWYINIIVILCLTTSVLSYTKIFLIPRHNQISCTGSPFSRTAKSSNFNEHYTSQKGSV